MSGPCRPSGRRFGVGAEDDAVLGRDDVIVREHGARGALGRVGVAVVDEQHVDVADA